MYLFWRGRATLTAAFRTMAITLVIVVLAFLMRQVASILAGTETGPVTLAPLATWNHSVHALAMAADVAALWAGVVLAAGVSSSTGRRFGPVCALVTAMNVAAMWIGYRML